MLGYIVWYYSDGINKYILVWRNFLDFIWFYFSINFLLKTLISPWHRDVSFSTWRGLHPVLFFQKLVNNLISRFMGMIVRIVTIILGIILAIIGVAVGFAGLILWLLSPIIFIVLGLLILFSAQILVKISFVFLLCIKFIFVKLEEIWDKKERERNRGYIEKMNDLWFR